MHKTTPHNKDYLAKMSAVPRLRNPQRGYERGMTSPVEVCIDIWGFKINLNEIISKQVLNSTVYREARTE